MTLWVSVNFNHFVTKLCAITAPFPVAAELMPAQHRRTYGAIYEICLASAFALLPLVAGFLAGSENGFRWIALPGGLALFVVPILVHLVIPQSARWQLRHGRTEAAVETVNQYIRRCGNKVPPLTVAELGELLTGTAPGRAADAEITVFESLGLAIEDLVAARLAYRNATDHGAGTWVDF